MTLLLLERYSGHQDGGEEIQVDEDIGTFFTSIDPLEQKLFYVTECYNRYNLGINKLTDENFELLRTSKMENKCISGSPTYDILNENEYKSAFYYKGL